MATWRTAPFTLVDKVPMVYKNIHGVVAAQTDLVTILGQFDLRLAEMVPLGSGRKIDADVECRMQIIDCSEGEAISAGHMLAHA